MRINTIYCELVRAIVPSGRGKGMFDGDILMYGFRESLLIMDKYKVLNDNIIRNFFLPNEKKEEMIMYFGKIQKAYISMLKFVNVCKFVLIKEWDYEYDLFYNKLDEFPSRSKIVLIEQKTKYTFKLTDLLHLTCIGLTHSDNLFAIPMTPKNPFTNLPFMYHNLVNIYMGCQRNMVQIPKIFNYFYESGFDVMRLKLYYEPFLREYTIKRYYDDMTNNDKYDSIVEILEMYKEIIPLHIHEEFPKELLIERFECVVYLNLKAKYSLIPYVQTTNIRGLENKLKLLYEENRSFGRMYFDTQRGRHSHINTMMFNFNVNDVEFGFRDSVGLSNNTVVINERPFIFGNALVSSNDMSNNVVNMEIDNIGGRELTRDQINQIRLREMLVGDDWGEDVLSDEGL